MAKNIEKMYSDLFKLRANLEDLAEQAQTVVAGSRDFPGLINKVVNEQLTKYFIPNIQKLSNDIKTPGSISGVIKFLDAVPLALTREKEPVSPVDPTVPENLNIETPTGSSNFSTVDKLPQNISYAKPEGEPTPANSVMESRKNSRRRVREASEDYKSIFQRIVDDFDIKSGPFAEDDIEVSDEGFFFESQGGTFEVKFDPSTGGWSWLSEGADGDDQIGGQQGRGWNNLIDSLLTSDLTLFMNAYGQSPQEYYI